MLCDAGNSLDAAIKHQLLAGLSDFPTASVFQRPRQSFYRTFSAFTPMHKTKQS